MILLFISLFASINVNNNAIAIANLASKEKDLVKAMKKLQSQSTSNISSITQVASIAALNGSADEDIEAMRVEFQKRKNFSFHLNNKKVSLKDAKLNSDGSLSINNKKVYNLR